MLITQKQFKDGAINKIKELQKTLNSEFEKAKANLEKENKWEDLYRIYDIYSESIYSLTNAINRVEKNN